MNAARALRVARLKAGLSQAELARRAGVPSQVVNRIELAQRVPRVDTLDRLLAAAGASLTVSRRLGAGIERGPIRELLAMPPRSRLTEFQRKALDGLRARAVRFVLVGDAAARLHGSPVDSILLEIVPGADHMNPTRLERARRLPAVRDLVMIADGHYEALMEDSEPLPWLPRPTRRALNRWLDGPKGFVASLEVLIGAASGQRRELLGALRDEIDTTSPGHRIYHSGSGT